jgi:hypothetical protein
MPRPKWWVPKYKGWIRKEEYERGAHARKRAASLGWYCDDDEYHGRWHDGETTREGKQVIDAYIKQVSRGKSVGKEFKDELLGWLRKLAKPGRQSLLVGKDSKGKPPGLFASSRERRLYKAGRIHLNPDRYWTLDAFARAHDLPRGGFFKRFREMDKIAKRLFPERAPSDKKAQPVTEELKLEIQNQYIRLNLRDHNRRVKYRNLQVKLDKLGIHRKQDFDEWRRPETIRHGEAMARLIKKYPNIPPFRLGQICRPVRNPKRSPRLKFPPMKKSKDGRYRFPRP